MVCLIFRSASNPTSATSSTISRGANLGIDSLDASQPKCKNDAVFARDDTKAKLASLSF